MFSLISHGATCFTVVATGTRIIAKISPVTFAVFKNFVWFHSQNEPG